MRHALDVNALAYTPDGRRLATVSVDGACTIWDVATSAPVGLVRRHSGACTCVEFIDDGRQLLTSSMDGTVRIWPARSLDPESLDLNIMLDAVRLWSGYDWDDEGNLRLLDQSERELIRNKLGDSDPLLMHQRQ